MLPSHPEEQINFGSGPYYSDCNAKSFYFRRATKIAALELIYHTEALRLLSITPLRDVATEARITTTEAACGRRLPAAIREWYSIAGAEELLTLGNNACGVGYLEDILNDLMLGRDKSEFYAPRQVNTGYQAYVALNGVDDPPVVADGDPVPVPFSQFVARLARYVVDGVFE